MLEFISLSPGGATSPMRFAHAGKSSFEERDFVTQADHLDIEFTDTLTLGKSDDAASSRVESGEELPGKGAEMERENAMPHSLPVVAAGKKPDVHKLLLNMDEWLMGNRQAAGIHR